LAGEVVTGRVVTGEVVTGAGIATSAAGFNLVAEMGLIELRSTTLVAIVCSFLEPMLADAFGIDRIGVVAPRQLSGITTVARQGR